ILFRCQLVIDHRGVRYKARWQKRLDLFRAAIYEAHGATRRPRQTRCNSQQCGLAGTVPSGEHHALTRGDFQRDAAQRIKPAVTFVDIFEADSCRRKARWRHRTASEMGASLLAPFQLVRASTLGNALSILASDSWTVICPK